MKRSKDLLQCALNALEYVVPAKAGIPLINSVLIPQDVFNLDSKIDDGTIDSAGNFIGAVSGKLRTMNGIDYWGSGCLTAIFSTTAYYEINHTAAECLLVMSLNN
jgi:hypothetical protein